MNCSTVCLLISLQLMIAFSLPLGETVKPDETVPEAKQDSKPGDLLTPSQLQTAALAPKKTKRTTKTNLQQQQSTSQAQESLVCCGQLEQTENKDDLQKNRRDVNNTDPDNKQRAGPSCCGAVEGSSDVKNRRDTNTTPQQTPNVPQEEQTFSSIKTKRHEPNTSPEASQNETNTPPKPDTETQTIFRNMKMKRQAPNNQQTTNQPSTTAIKPEEKPIMHKSKRSSQSTPTTSSVPPQPDSEKQNDKTTKRDTTKVVNQQQQSNKEGSQCCGAMEEPRESSSKSKRQTESNQDPNSQDSPLCCGQHQQGQARPERQVTPEQKETTTSQPTTMFTS